MNINKINDINEEVKGARMSETRWHPSFSDDLLCFRFHTILGV